MITIQIISAQEARDITAKSQVVINQAVSEINAGITKAAKEGKTSFTFYCDHEATIEAVYQLIMHQQEGDPHNKYSVKKHADGINDELLIFDWSTESF